MTPRQEEQVVEILRMRGAAGVCATYLLDNAEPRIRRAAARIHTLRTAGFLIDSDSTCDIEGHPTGEALYVLVGEPDAGGQIEALL